MRMCLPDVNAMQPLSLPKRERSKHIKKTCVYLKHGEMVKQFDRFSQNDAFVKIIPDYDNERAVRSATIKNQYVTHFIYKIWKNF